MKIRLLFLLPLFSALLHTQIYAEEMPQQTVSVFPSSLNLSSIANDTLQETIRYSNKLPVPVQVSLSIEPIVEGTEQNRAIVAEWVSLSETELRLEPDSFTDIITDIAVPKGAEAGTYFFRIKADTTAINPAGSLDQFLIGNDLSTQISLRIQGKIYEEATISEITTPQFLQSSGNLEFTVTNNSTISITPVGSIVLSNSLSTYNQPIPLNRMTIGPGEYYTYSVPLPNKLLWGKHEIAVTLQYGPSHNTLSQDAHFYIIPYKETGLAFTIFLALSLIAFFIIRHHDRVTRALYDLSHDK